MTQPIEARNGSFTASQQAADSDTPPPATSKPAPSGSALGNVISEIDAIVQDETRTLSAIARTAMRAARAAARSTDGEPRRMLLDLADVFAALSAGICVLADAVNGEAEAVGHHYCGEQPGEQAQ